MLSFGTINTRIYFSLKAEHIVDSGGTSSHYWYLGYDIDQTRSNPLKASVNDPQGRMDYYFFNYTTNGRTWSDGLVQRIERRTSPYASPPLQLLRTEETAWAQDLPSAGYIVNPRVTSRTMTLETGQSARQEYVYTDDGTGNVREVKEFGFDGLLARKTVTQYWHETHPAYAALNLTRLLSSVSVRDGARAEAARTEYLYDEGSLTAYGGTIVNRDPAYGASYATRGNVSAVCRYYREGGRYIVSTTAYDILGNMVSSTDARGNTTAVSFAPSSSGIYALVRSVTDALGQVTQ